MMARAFTIAGLISVCWRRWRDRGRRKLNGARLPLSAFSCWLGKPQCGVGGTARSIGIAAADRWLCSLWMCCWMQFGLADIALQADCCRCVDRIYRIVILIGPGQFTGMGEKMDPLGVAALLLAASCGQWDPVWP